MRGLQESVRRAAYLNVALKQLAGLTLTSRGMSRTPLAGSSATMAPSRAGVREVRAPPQLPEKPWLCAEQREPLAYRKFVGPGGGRKERWARLGPRKDRRPLRLTGGRKKEAADKEGRDIPG
jgi:hypothetical protein